MDHIGAAYTPVKALSACNGPAHISAALLVGRRSRFDRRVVKPALSTCGLAFRRFLLEGASAAAPSFVRRLRPPRVSGPALRDACGACWGSSGGLPEAGRGSPWVASGVLGGGRWPSSPALCIWRH